MGYFVFIEKAFISQLVSYIFNINHGKNVLLYEFYNEIEKINILILIIEK